MTNDEVITLFKSLVAALNANQRREVNRISLALIAAEAPIGERWKTISTLMHTNGEYTAAREAMRLYVAFHKQAPRAKFDQAALLAQTGKLDEAWAIMQTVPSNVPDPAGHAFILGSMAVNLGTIPEAQKNLLRALDHNPLLGQAMLSLAVSEKLVDGNPIGDRILAVEPKIGSAPDLEQGHYYYAIGKILFDRKETDLAFAAFAKGASIVRKMRPYDGGDNVDDVAKCREGYTVELISQLASSVTNKTDRPIFVTGLPRSGTTLVEQILVSHSQVVGGEELGIMPTVQREIGSPGAAAVQSALKRTSVDALVDFYLHLASERFGATGRFVDKSLNASRHIGLIASLLPDAPIVWMRRSALDCAWSAFRTYFMRGLDWSWHLPDIAHHFKLEDALFEHWTTMLGDRILVVNYEEMVADPEPHIRRLLMHCGLSEEPGVFTPHKTKRTVTTASVMQVRQPINTGAIDSAGPYRSHLKPFIDAYGAST